MTAPRTPRRPRISPARRRHIRAIADAAALAVLSGTPLAEAVAWMDAQIAGRR